MPKHPPSWAAWSKRSLCDMNMTLHDLAAKIESTTGLRVIAAHFPDLNPERIESFLRDQVRIVELQHVLDGRIKPKQNLFLLSHDAESPDLPSTASLYEFTVDAAVDMDRLFKGSDEFGYHLN